MTRSMPPPSPNDHRRPLRRDFGALLLAFAILTGGTGAAACSMQRFANIPVTMSGLTPLVSAKVAGVDARLIADSGAFFSLITPQAARKFGLKVGPLPVGVEVTGVTGQADAGLATAKEFSVPGFALHNTDFLVGAPQLNDWGDGLLGENLLGFKDTEFDFANGAIHEYLPVDCAKASLAYWATGIPYSAIDIHTLSTQADSIRGMVKVNGVSLRAIFDTGAPRSILSLRAARAAGMKTDGPDVKPGGMSGGIGRRTIETWIAPVTTFQIGEEQVRNTSLRIGDIELDGDDMLVGADFFLSHRILVSRSQSKLYLTYNGGPVFSLDSADGRASPPALVPSEKLADGDAYARRAAAFAARGEYKLAIADLTQAVALEPNDPKHLIDRGQAYWRDGQSRLAGVDFDAALKLKPDDVEALMDRGRFRQRASDSGGATQDFSAAVKLDPSRFEPVAQAYLSADRFADAVGVLDTWIADHPKDEALATALTVRCFSRGALGSQLDQAEADCDAALRLAPGSVGTFDSRGLVRLRRGEIDKAIADYTAALRVAPDNALSLYGRGVAELRKGLKAQSDADIAAATAHEPDIAATASKFGVTP